MANVYAVAAFAPKALALAEDVRVIWPQLTRGSRWAMLGKLAVIAGVTVLSKVAYEAMSDDDRDNYERTVLDQAQKALADGEATDVANTLADLSAEAHKLLSDQNKDAAVGSAARGDVQTMLQSRISAIKHTGDGQATAINTEALTMIDGAVSLLQRAMGALGIYDPNKLQILRDVVFMDQDLFAIAIKRVRP